ncbi:hypothetical protein [Caulobacter sp. Root1472]|jgi:hypothetical protein|uniref:hypothetical protein n=1 Tax=Caulobacter sp. Root1472 TaxID=1736470 RepID=UPI0006F50E86|nr:hypothetical protein [Caulobacter sp. Root1472]KQZ18991.1 hypothetical protein ASD47_09410 [Caulobacter sp. Root1472]
MARHHDIRLQHLGVAGLTLLGVLLLIAALVVGGWRSGLLTVRSADLSMRLPERPALPHRSPDPAPLPLPKPGPGVEQG